MKPGSATLIALWLLGLTLILEVWTVRHPLEPGQVGVFVGTVGAVAMLVREIRDRGW